MKTLSTKPTAVEWLEKEINARGPIEKNVPTWLKELYEQALAMEKEQIIVALGVGCQIKPTGPIGYYEVGEEYYNETYGK